MYFSRFIPVFAHYAMLCHDAGGEHNENMHAFAYGTCTYVNIVYIYIYIYVFLIVRLNLRVRDSKVVICNCGACTLHSAIYMQEIYYRSLYTSVHAEYHEAILCTITN